VIPHPALAIAGKSITPEGLTSVPLRIVRRGKSYFVFHVLDDANSRLDSIRRSSSFKTHLKKHGLDPNAYLRFSTPDHSPVEVWQSTQPEGIMEGQVSTADDSSSNGEVSLLALEPGLPELWDSDSLFSFPMDPCKSITVADPCLPLVMTSFPFHYSISFDHAAGAHLCGFLQPSDASLPNSPDGIRKRSVFRIRPTSIPSILFGVLLTHGNDSSPDT
jgi:hypothetical protein